MGVDKDDLLIITLKNINDKVDKLDTKFDSMHEVLTNNTIVLTDHERRSTASEKRITVLEDKDISRVEKENQFKGFFIYAGAIVTTLGGLAVLFQDSISAFLAIFRHK